MPSMNVLSEKRSAPNHLRRGAAKRCPAALNPASPLEGNPGSWETKSSRCLARPTLRRDVAYISIHLLLETNLYTTHYVLLPSMRLTTINLSPSLITILKPYPYLFLFYIHLLSFLSFFFFLYLSLLTYSPPSSNTPYSLRDDVGVECWRRGESKCRSETCRVGYAGSAWEQGIAVSRRAP